MTVPEFIYDISSPYAYLAAARIDEVLGMRARWQPVSFGFMVRDLGKVPWSLGGPSLAAGQAEVEARAAARGLPPVRWPAGWPSASYSLHPLRALVLLEDPRALTVELYRVMFVLGEPLAELDVVLDACERVGLDRAAMAEVIRGPEASAALRSATEAALASGVTGVPTVRIGEQLFWGDDQLEAAAAALALTPPTG